MAVLIKGMEMPTSCFKCPLNYDSINCIVSDIELREKGGGDFLFEHERSSKCPLVPVPPHGRLIDADALERDGWYLMRVNTAGGKYEAGRLTIAPTVIEPEEGE